MDNQTQNENTFGTKSNILRHHCTTCNTSFTTAATLRRHQNSRHTETVTKYQCWNCHNTYVRKESVLKHSITVHNDHDKKFVIIKTTNTRYRPEIFTPEPWTPPAEARLKGTIYTIQIPSSAPTRPIPTITIIPPEKDWEPMTVDEIDYRFNPKPDIEQDLEISSSESDSSITSTGTMCLDEREEAYL